jgi:predicted metal-dependent hydrolase
MIKPDKIIRSHRKTLCVSVDSLGQVIVRAPLRCSDERIFAFLQEKSAWMQKHTAKREGAGARLPSENLDGFVFMLLGKEYTLKLYDGQKIALDSPSQTLWLPKKNSRERLVKWLKENALRIFTQESERISAWTGLRFKEIKLSTARKKWGSCDGDNVIRYVFRLIYTPKEMIEYVVLHELCHVKEKNHSKAFWALVERYMPDWKKRRLWLKNHGYLLHIF